MNTLFPEVIELIVAEADSLSKWHLFNVSKLFQNICKKFIDGDTWIAFWNSDILSLMLSKDLNKLALYFFNEICYIGYMPLVNKYIKLYDRVDWFQGLSGACRGGHIDIINLMIQRGANKCDYCKKLASEHLN